MSFSKICQILFIVGSTFPILIPECLYNFWWWFSSSSTFEDRRNVSSISYPFYQRFVILAWCHTLIIVLIVRNFFHPSGAIQESFQFDSSEPIISGLFILSFQLSFSKSYWCFIQIFSNKFKIYLSSCIKSPQVSSFVFQFFPVICVLATFIFQS